MAYLARNGMVSMVGFNDSLQMETECPHETVKEYQLRYLFGLFNKKIAVCLDCGMEIE